MLIAQCGMQAAVSAALKSSEGWISLKTASPLRLKRTPKTLTGAVKSNHHREKPAVLLWVAMEYHCPLVWGQRAAAGALWKFQRPLNLVFPNGSRVLHRLEPLICNTQQHGKVRADVILRQCPQQGHRTQAVP